MKWIKRLLLILVLLVVLFVVAAVVLVVTVDPNEYKGLIVEQVEKATGRRLMLAGDLDLSLFPWLGLQMGAAQLSNAKGFADEPFARVEEVQVRVAVMPLFKGEVHADTVKLKGLQVNLSKNKDGVTNWDDLVAEQKDKQAQPERKEEIAAPAALAIGGVDIDHAALRWQDAQSGTDVAIEPFNLKTGALSIGEPFDLNMDLRAVNKQPQVDASVTLESKVTVDPQTQVYELSDMQLNVDAKGPSLPQGQVKAGLSTDVVANLDKGTVQVEPLTLKALLLALTGQLRVTGLTSTPKLSGTLKSDPFSPRVLLKDLGQAPIQTADPNVLNEAALEMAFNADADGASLSSLNVQLDDSELTGKAAVKSFSKPQISFAFSLDQMDADRYLPPKPEGEAPKQAQQAPEQAPMDDRIALPVEQLRELNVKGTLQAGKLKVSNLKLSEIKATITAKDGVVQLKPVSTALYGGKVNSGVSLDARQDTPAFAVSTDLQGVLIGELMADLQEKKAYLKGKSKVAFDLKTRGDRVSVLKQQLDGTADLAVTDGALRDPQLAQKVEAVVAFLQGREPKPAGEELIFDSLTGSAVINKGLLRNDDLKLVTPLVLAKGKGSANLDNDTVDYTLGLALAGGDPNKDRTFVPITINGPLANLDYGVDLDKLAKEKLKTELDEKKAEVKEKLDEKLKHEGDKLKEKLKGKLKLF